FMFHSTWNIRSSCRKATRKRRLIFETLEDRTAPAIHTVRDINTDPTTEGSAPHKALVVNGTLYFRAETPATGIELWKSDGVPGGVTTVVKDINPGEGGSIWEAPVALNNSVYFLAYDGVATGIWKTDGTLSGTVPIWTTTGHVGNYLHVFD